MMTLPKSVQTRLRLPGAAPAGLASWIPPAGKHARPGKARLRRLPAEAAPLPRPNDRPAATGHTHPGQRPRRWPRRRMLFDRRVHGRHPSYRR